MERYQDLIPCLKLPDENDRHVLAAAIVSAADAIVTFNAKDFPESVLQQYQLDLIHPDDFIFHQFGIDDAAVLVSVQRCRERLKNPPRTASEYLDTLEKQSLPKTVAHLRPYAGII
ncbi:hypothetical protein ACWGS9_25150 [Bradyrhizobium sp. Arg314]